jgi:hypothetical protein
MSTISKEIQLLHIFVTQFRIEWDRFFVRFQRHGQFCIWPFTSGFAAGMSVIHHDTVVVEFEAAGHKIAVDGRSQPLFPLTLDVVPVDVNVFVAVGALVFMIEAECMHCFMHTCLKCIDRLFKGAMRFWTEQGQLGKLRILGTILKPEKPNG